MNARKIIDILKEKGVLFENGLNLQEISRIESMYDENNEFWYSGWGIQPNDLEEAIKICKNEMEKAPKLIPICSHRYIPSEPQEIGTPIFSVYQTDIIYYGEDLLSYLQIEFGIKKYEDMNFDSIKDIRFWSELQS